MSNKSSVGIKQAASAGQKLARISHNPKKKEVLLAKTAKEIALYREKAPTKSQAHKLPVGKQDGFTEKYSHQAELIEDKTLLRNIELQGIDKVKATSEREEKLIKLLRGMTAQQFKEYKEKLYNTDAPK